MFFLNGGLAWELFIAQALTVAAAGFVLGRRFGVLSGLLLAWTGISALRVYGTPQPLYAEADPTLCMSLCLGAAATWAAIFLAVFSVQLFRIGTWIFLFQLFALVNAFDMLFINHAGLLFNESMGGGLIACTVPFFFGKPWARKPLLAAGALLFLSAAIFLTGKNQPIALLILAHLVPLYRRRRWALILITLTAGVGLLLWAVGPTLFLNPSGRQQVWRDAFLFFRQGASPLFGTGLGTFYYIGPILTLKARGEAFIWLHSDWLQIGFEMGAGGLFLALAFYAQALRLSILKDLRLFTALLCYGALGVANFPLHNPISALFGVILLASATAQEDTHRRRPSCPALIRKLLRPWIRFFEAYRPESASPSNAS